MRDESKSCKCGYKLGDPWVVPKSIHSFWGLLIVSIGISHPPTELRLQCEKCGEVLKVITDRKELRGHAYH